LLIHLLKWVQNGRDTATSCEYRVCDHYFAYKVFPLSAHLNVVLLTPFVPVGPIFDNAYHHFLRNTIIEDTAGAFASNTSPFPIPDGDLGNWFLVDNFLPNELAHLDTDVTLAFPSLNTSHPDYSADTTNFAGDNNLFLQTFFAALHKMGRLGVNVELFKATVCKDSCGNQTEPIPGRPQCIIILAKFLESAHCLTCFPF
jgi:hypothetical protein